MMGGMKRHLPIIGISGIFALVAALVVAGLATSHADISTGRRYSVQLLDGVTGLTGAPTVTGFCMYTLPDADGQPVLHLRVTAVCQEKDKQGAVVRAEPCTVDKPAQWWVDNGLVNQGQITSINAIWDHASQPANVGKAVPRKRLDGTEVLEDLR